MGLWKMVSVSLRLCETKSAAAGCDRMHRWTTEKGFRVVCGAEHISAGRFASVTALTTDGTIGVACHSLRLTAGFRKRSL